MTLRIVQFSPIPDAIVSRFKLVAVVCPVAHNESQRCGRGAVSFLGRNFANLSVSSLLGLILGHSVDEDGPGAEIGLALALLSVALIIDFAEAKKPATSKTASAVRDSLVNSPLAAIGLVLLVGQLGYVGIAVGMMMQTFVYCLSNTQRDKLAAAAATALTTAMASFATAAAYIHADGEASGSEVGAAIGIGVAGAAIGALPHLAQIWAPHSIFTDPRNVVFGNKLVINMAVAGLLCTVLGNPVSAAGVIPVTVLATWIAKKIDEQTSQRASDGVYGAVLTGNVAAIAAALLSNNSYPIVVASGLGVAVVTLLASVMSGEFKHGRMALVAGPSLRTVVIDSSNGGPVSLQQALEYFAEPDNLAEHATSLA